MNSFTNWNPNDKVGENTSGAATGPNNTGSHQSSQFNHSSSHPNLLPGHNNSSNNNNNNPTEYTRIQDMQQHQQSPQSSSSSDGSSTDIKTDHSPSSKKYNHRAVSTTKRAEQNRNAQRAFRVRKEKYIKDLEEKAQEVDQLKATIENLEIRNRAMTKYICELQRQMLDTKGDGVVNNDIINANSIDGTGAGAGNLGIHNASNVP
ncbi:putative transcription factor kapC [Candida viswanathii]|uniref:Putative transcription factor kapC n=1 Tax=Candida viswanathii TaxID=5486 RepID=A0A367YR04_9ASCO|nr:putative transcription factor kapC [Candida viswanathii]